MTTRIDDQSESALRRLWAEKRKSIKPKAVTMFREELVDTGFLAERARLPLVVRPRLAPVNLPLWVKTNRRLVEDKLLEHGGILFRGFELNTQCDFEQFLESLPIELMHYIEGATPRTELGGRVYTSTEYPADQSIALHNELTYVTTWPMRICFFCAKPPDRGGETPIADVRRIYNRIDPAVREKFEERGWMLVRNFGSGFSLPWQASFRTSDRAKVEEYCDGARIEYEWNAGDRLRTRQVRPAVATHPKTGEKVWFNHILFWHVSSLDRRVRETLLAEFGVEGLPYNTYYGDGSTIEDSAIEEIRKAYDQERTEYRWQKGDLLLLDNMLVAHGRNPFGGPRQILVAMGDSFTRTDY
jgi:alpha-ketoglutarate-dependent taurine dioxygenase